MNLPKVNSSFITTPIKNAMNATKNAVNNIQKNVFKNVPKNDPKNDPKNEFTNAPKNNSKNYKNERNEPENEPKNERNERNERNEPKNERNEPKNERNEPKNEPRNERNESRNERNEPRSGIFSSFKNTARSVFDGMSEDVKAPIMESVNGSNNSSMTVPIIIGLGILIVAFVIVVMFRTQIAIALEVAWDNIKGMFVPSPVPVESPPPEFVKELEELEEPVEKLLPSRKEVFNIAQDKYTYTDAEPLCKAFGAELATYDQVKEAWDKGADWCNYGWVKGQSAVYPTQEATYNKLQAGPEDQRDACGVPGVNGGFFDNPELRFGVNCYGKKPSENEADARKIMAQNANLTPGALEYNKKVQNYKTEMGQIPVNPFKPNLWSN